jgi:hypothetical protein
MPAYPDSSALQTTESDVDLQLCRHNFVVIRLLPDRLQYAWGFINACCSQARPIVMTTPAMGAGMLPIAMGFGADPSFRSPMAIAVIGGLVTSTPLSLVVVPAVYTYVDDAEGLFHRLWAKRPDWMRQADRQRVTRSDMG